MKLKLTCTIIYDVNIKDYTDKKTITAKEMAAIDEKHIDFNELPGLFNPNKDKIIIKVEPFYEKKR